MIINSCDNSSRAFYDVPTFTNDIYLSPSTKLARSLSNQEKHFKPEAPNHFFGHQTKRIVVETNEDRSMKPLGVHVLRRHTRHTAISERKPSDQAHGRRYERNANPLRYVTIARAKRYCATFATTT